MPSVIGNEHVNGDEHGAGELQDTTNLIYPSRSLHFLKRLEKSASDVRTQPCKQSNIRLKVIVVGAGLGGLSTSIALSRRGHTVTVVEAAAELGEVGAGIQVPPNSTRLLLSWGIAPFLEGKAVEPEAITLRRWSNGAKIGHTKLLPDFKNAYDAPYWVVHRAHLLDALYKLALQHGVHVETNSRVMSYDPETPALTLQNGDIHEADLIVGADGVKSMARPVVLGGVDRAPEFTKFAAYRATVSTSLMRADPEVSWLLERPGQNLWLGPQRHIMAYTIAAGKTFNMVISHPSTSDPSTWTQDDNMTEMMSQFHDWDPQIVKVLGMVESTLRWPLSAYTDALPRWLHPGKRLCILGDAAHSMLPYMSQGAAMAVEDGAALAEALDKMTSRDEMGQALDLWAQVRQQRTSGMQQASWVQGKLWHFEDGPEQQARDDSMRPEVEGLPFVESANQWSDPVTQVWTYAYDAEKEIEDAWKALRRGRKLNK